MGQIGQFISQNPELVKGAGDALNASKGEQNGFDLKKLTDPLGSSLNKLGDTQFAATEEYNRQRAQGMPEPMKPQLQDVESSASDVKLSDYDKGKEFGSALKDIFSGNQPATDSDMDVAMPGPTVNEKDDKNAKLNALKGLFK